jgi:iron-sulfur cluster repair protein YtfE (RIC family)
MNIIDALIGEHAALLTLFGHIERHGPSWGLRAVKDAGLLLESMLMTHGLLEDRLLFDAVPSAEGAVRDVLESMRGEHKAIAATLERLRAATTEAAAKGLLARVIEIAREHFAVEERVLFELAGRALGAEKARELGREWAARRGLSITG